VARVTSHSARRQQGFADDDGCQAHHDGADAHGNVGTALGLHVQRTCQCNQRIGQGHAGQRHAVGGNALGPCHARVGTGGAQRQPASEAKKASSNSLAITTMTASTAG
jgi:hypothetical protein